MESDLIDKANKYYEKRIYRKALAVYETIVSQSGEDSTIRERLARCYYEFGSLEKARQECQTEIELNEKSIDAYVLLGLILEKQNKLQEAARILEQAIELNPNSAELYTSLGRVLGNQGKLEESLEAYRRAIELDSGFWKAHFNRATIFRAKRQFTDAVNENSKAFRIAPSLMTAYWALVSYELTHQYYFATANILLLLIVVLFRSVFLIPFALLFAVAIAYRAFLWFQYKLFTRGVLTILIGLLALLWYLYGMLK